MCACVKNTTFFNICNVTILNSHNMLLYIMTNYIKYKHAHIYIYIYIVYEQLLLHYYIVLWRLLNNKYMSAFLVQKSCVI